MFPENAAKLTSKFQSCLSLPSALWQFQQTSQFTDMVLACSDGDVPAHRAMLSVVFKLLGVEIGQEGCMVLPDTEKVEVEQALMEHYLKADSTNLLNIFYPTKMKQEMDNDLSVVEVKVEVASDEECSAADPLKLGHRSKVPLAEDIRKERALNRVKAKVGEEIANDLLDKWKQVQNDKDKGKKKLEGDNIIRTLKSLGFSDIEIKSLLHVGSSRINRIASNQPKVPAKAPKHAANTGDTSRIVDFILSLALEPGYPCAHRSVPLYIVGYNEGSNWRKLHQQYKELCESQDVRSLSTNRFREYVHHFFPTLKIGKTKADICIECFKLKIRLDDLELSSHEKLNVKEKLSLDLNDTFSQQRVVNEYIDGVKNRVAPNELPISFKTFNIDQFNNLVLKEALNLHKVNTEILINPGEMSMKVETEMDSNNFVAQKLEDQPNIKIEEDYYKPNEIEDMKDTFTETYRLTKEVKNGLKDNIKNLMTGDQGGTFSENIANDITRSLSITIETYGSDTPLPHYGMNTPTSDYFNSSLHLRNMNIIDPSTGSSSIFLYDERNGGKDANSICSVRWEALKIRQHKHYIHNTKPAEHHVGIYENSYKSNTIFKFEVLQTILGFYKTKNKLYLLPGHSHSSAEAKTAEINRCLDKKHLYTAHQVSQELQTLQNDETFLLNNEHFFYWETLLNKYINDMPVEFTAFNCFEIANGKVTMRKLSEDDSNQEVVTKVLVENVVATKSAIIEELFGLPSDATLDEIILAPIKLQKLEENIIPEKRLSLIKKKYQTIPSEHIWYYPEGGQ